MEVWISGHFFSSEAQSKLIRFVLSSMCVSFSYKCIFIAEEIMQTKEKNKVTHCPSTSTVNFLAFWYFCQVFLSIVKVEIKSKGENNTQLNKKQISLKLTAIQESFLPCHSVLCSQARTLLHSGYSLQKPLSKCGFRTTCIKVI